MLEGDPYPGTFRFMLARNPMSPVRDPILDKINIYFVFRYHSHFLYGLDSFIQYFQRNSQLQKQTLHFIETITKLLFCCRYPSQWQQITIDPQVGTADGQMFDVMFIGTDKACSLLDQHSYIIILFCFRDKF